MRRIAVDTSVYQFMVTKSASAKQEQDGAQKFVKNGADKGAPIWQFEVVALDKANEGGETLSIAVSGMRPEFIVGQIVTPVGLIAIPWQNNGRAGVSYKADSVQVAAGAAASA